MDTILVIAQVSRMVWILQTFWKLHKLIQKRIKYVDVNGICEKAYILKKTISLI